MTEDRKEEHLFVTNAKNCYAREVGNVLPSSVLLRQQLEELLGKTLEIERLLQEVRRTRIRLQYDASTCTRICTPQKPGVRRQPPRYLAVNASPRLITTIMITTMGQT